MMCGFSRTAKPSARESAGGFAFVPLRAAWGDVIGLSKNGVPPLRLFYGGKMQNFRRRVARLVPLLVPQKAATIPRPQSRAPFGLRRRALPETELWDVVGRAMLLEKQWLFLLAIC